MTTPNDNNENATLSSKQTPFYMVPKPVHKAKLSGNEFAVYCGLLYFANNETSVAFPSYRVISETANVSVKTAQRAIKVLEEKGLIEVERKYNKETKRYFANHYTILSIDKDWEPNLTGGSVNMTPGVASQSPRNKTNNLTKIKDSGLDESASASKGEDTMLKGNIDPSQMKSSQQKPQQGKTEPKTDLERFVISFNRSKRLTPKQVQRLNSKLDNDKTLEELWQDEKFRTWTAEYCTPWLKSKHKAAIATDTVINAISNIEWFTRYTKGSKISSPPASHDIDFEAFDASME